MSLLDNSIIDRGIEKATGVITDAKWVDKLAENGKRAVVPKLPAGLQSAAGQSIDRIVASKGAVGAVSAGTFLKITSYFGMGMEDEARLLYLRERATHDERQSAMKKAIGQAYDANIASKQAWDEVKATALDVLKFMGQAAIPLLLAMV